jgi:small basic protein (TIGR04137 family)
MWRQGRIPSSEFWSLIVSIDKSLKKPSGVVRARNVLKRGERILVLKEQDRWLDDQSPLGLPKVRVAKPTAGKKKKKKEEEGEGEATSEETT